MSDELKQLILKLTVLVEELSALLADIEYLVLTHIKNNRRAIDCGSAVILTFN